MLEIRDESGDTRLFKDLYPRTVFRYHGNLYIKTVSVTYVNEVDMNALDLEIFEIRSLDKEAKVLPVHSSYMVIM